jgi:hypothetical protein
MTVPDRRAISGLAVTPSLYRLAVRSGDVIEEPDRRLRKDHATL